MLLVFVLAPALAAPDILPPPGTDLPMRRLTSDQQARGLAILEHPGNAEAQDALPHLALGAAGNEEAQREGERLSAEGKFNWYGIQDRSPPPFHRSVGPFPGRPGTGYHR